VGCIDRFMNLNEKMARITFIVEALVREYQRYTRWCARVNTMRCPIEHYFKGICEELDVDVADVKAAYERA